MPLVFLLYALFALVFTVSKFALEYTQPLFFIGSRMLVAGIILCSYIFLFRREQFTFKWHHFKNLFFLALFNIYLTNIFEFWGLQYLTSFKTCFIYSLSPFVAALFSYLIYSERLSLKKWIGLVIGFAGLMPMLLSQTTAEERAGQLFFISWPELSVMAAAVSSVYGWILMKQLVKDDGYSPLMANGLSMLMGGSMALVHSFAVESWQPFPFTEFLPVAGSMALLIVISNLVCYNLYGVLLRKFSATFMSFAGLSTPLFTALFGWLFLGEIPSTAFYVSLTVVFGGLLFFYQEEIKAVPETSEMVSAD